MRLIVNIELNHRRPISTFSNLIITPFNVRMEKNAKYLKFMLVCACNFIYDYRS